LFTRKIIVITLIIICLGICSAIAYYLTTYTSANKVSESKQSGQINLQNASFAVIYSDAMRQGAEIVTYNSSGKILDKKALDGGRALYHTEENGGDYYIASERQNHHFKLTKTGEIISFYGPAIYDKDRAIGTSFIRRSNDYMFYSMNMGLHPKYSPDRYSNELVYWNDKTHLNNHIILPGYFQSAFEMDDKAYVLYIDESIEKVGIYVVDLMKNQLIHDFPIDNHKTSNSDGVYYPTGRFNGSSLQVFQNRILVLLDGNRPDIEGKPIIQVINPANGVLEKEIKLSTEGFNLYSSTVYDDQLYLISSGNQVNVLDQKFQLHEGLTLEKTTSFMQKVKEQRGSMCGTYLIGDSVYVLYDFVKNKPADRDREIHKYNLKTGREEAVIPLSYKSDKEMISFLVFQ